MKTICLLALSMLVAITIRLPAADNGPSQELYFPHEHVQKIEVKDTDIPFETTLTMKEHDAVIFILPGQKSVSLWCYRPEDRASLAEQETKSGLKTSWAEKPWIMPRMKWKALGGGSFQGDGLDSYIELGGVTTQTGRHSDYTLYVGRLQMTIIEDLSATNGLPVIVKVLRTNRRPQQSSVARGNQSSGSDTNETSEGIGSQR